MVNHMTRFTILILGLVALVACSGAPPSIASLNERITGAVTCERLYPIRSDIDDLVNDGQITETQWGGLMDAIAARAETLRPQMDAGEDQALCADLIVPCLPRGAICTPDLSP